MTDCLSVRLSHLYVLYCLVFFLFPFFFDFVRLSYSNICPFIGPIYPTYLSPKYSQSTSLLLYCCLFFVSLLLSSHCSHNDSFFGLIIPSCPLLSTPVRHLSPLHSSLLHSFPLTLLTPSPTLLSSPLPLPPLPASSSTSFHSKELTEGVADYLLKCQTYEGGFGGEPGNEAHGGYNFCTLAGLLILGKVSCVCEWVRTRVCVKQREEEAACV